MDAHSNDALFGQVSQGVGATAEAELATLSPLIEYYERELPGRLMIAASFLEDIKLMEGWSAHSPEAQLALAHAKALVVSVMVRIMNAQQDCSCGTAETGGNREGRHGTSSCRWA
jgi:hypothetical protein